MAKETNAAPEVTFPKGQLPDGIYVGLGEDAYHADAALGSSNIREILKGANQYWHESWMNPARPKRKRTDSLVLGAAVHKLLLEGLAEFDKIYRRGPYSSDDDHLSSGEKAALTRKAKEKLLEGQELLKGDDYDFAMGVKTIIDEDEELAGCLDGGLSEVSVFWTRPDGVRVKARFDKLKVPGIGDIKTIANERRRDLEVACYLDITTYRYDIPAEHYLDGRAQMGRLLDEGLVYVGGERLPLEEARRSDGEARLVKFLRACAKYDQLMGDASFQFVFVPKTGAPDAFSCTLLPTYHDETTQRVVKNPILDAARRDIETAIDRYKAALERFGTNRRWLPLRKVEELTIDKLPISFGRMPVRR